MSCFIVTGSNLLDGNAEVEDKGTLEFRVDRHKLDQGTPRKIITPVKQLGSTGKKRKLDEGNTNYKKAV